MAFNKTNITETAPDWNARGAEPPATLKRNGFTAGYKPPAAFFNWFWTKVSVLLAQIATAVESIQNYLNKNFYYRYDTGDDATMTTLISNMQQGNTYTETCIIMFTVNASLYNSFRIFGVNYGVVGELNCKTKTVFFPEQGITLMYKNSAWQKVKIRGSEIASSTISAENVAFEYYTLVDGGTYQSLNDIDAAYTQYIDEWDNGGHAITQVHFRVAHGRGSLASICHNANTGILNCVTGVVVFDNGEIFTNDSGTWLPTLCVHTGAIDDGAITYDKLSDDLKTMLGI